MKQRLIVSTFFFYLSISLSAQSSDATKSSLKKMQQVDFSNVVIQDEFWTPRLNKYVSTTLPVCLDQIENKTDRIRNFENVAKGTGKHSGIYFDDSDVYKALEGIAYSLINHKDVILEKKADEWIDKIAAAQQSDGYIDTYYTLNGLNKRWTDMGKHEMYCAGHMMEAGVAYYKATGKRKLLDVCIRMADHMIRTFGPDKRHWVPGHEEVELALVKLYNTTQDRRYLDFANWLLEERGNGYFVSEAHGKAEYYQDEIPVRKLRSIGGHAVRSMYLYCGMADVASAKNDSSYIGALDSLWNDVVYRNMYITGGIGSSKNNEGFTADYDLPNKEAYCETCASVGMVLWNQRMNEFTGNSKYIDILERSMYNGALAGISLTGDRFFYVNPLESDGNHHRKAWYGCACCPSQISRFLPSIGNYIYAISDKALWINLFIGNKAEIPIKDGENIAIKMETQYPWQGIVKLTFSSPLKKQIRIRIPGWCKSYSIAVNGKKVKLKNDAGYAVINRIWKANDVMILNMRMPVEVVAADPKVKQDIDKRAIQRGPLVYCLEEVDNKDDYSGLFLSPRTSFYLKYDNNLLNGVELVKATSGNKVLNLIPYYAWDNREAGKMKVWIDYKQ